MNTTEIKKRRLLEALRKSLGVVTTACEKADVSRRVYYDWMKKDPKFRADVNDMNEVALDFAESQLFKNIQNGKEASTIFYLKTKGKKRGYIERQEIDGRVENDVTIRKGVNLKKLTDEQLMQLEELANTAGEPEDEE